MTQFFAVKQTIIKIVIFTAIYLFLLSVELLHLQSIETYTCAFDSN